MLQLLPKHWLMKLRVILAALALSSVLGLTYGVVSDGDQITTVAELITRILADATGTQPTFELSLDSSSAAQGIEYFALSSTTDGTTVSITGTSGVALASGFHWWLKYYAKCSISW